MLLAHPGSSAHASGAYPDHAIRLIVPFSPGGSADIIARILAAKLSHVLAAGVVVENRPGASGIVGTAFEAGALPDGYTLELVNSAHVSNPSLHKLSYDAVTSFTPISMVARVASMLLASTSSPVKTVAQLIASAKADPGKIDFGSLGIGSSNYMPMALFMSFTGTKLSHVPYSNGGTMNTDLLAGRIPLAFITVPSGLSLTKTGKAVVVAVASGQRLPVLPQTPTIAESGVPGFEFFDWDALIGPAELPAEIIAKLNAAVRTCLDDPQMRERLAQQGAQPAAGSPAQLRSFLAENVAKWQRIAKQLDAQAK